MRNELYFCKGSGFRSVFGVSLASTRKLNLFQGASRLQKKRDSGGKRTHDPCPPDSLRGICSLLKKASFVGLLC